MFPRARAVQTAVSGCDDREEVPSREKTANAGLKILMLKKGETMSKDNAFRFMIIKNKDESIKSAYDAILSKYQGKNLSDNEWDDVLKEEIIPLAKEYGYDFTPEDLKELQKNAEGKLSDEELSEVTGGGRKYFWWESVDTCYCEYAGHDDPAFLKHYSQEYADCPSYEWEHFSPNTHQCICYSHLR